MLTWLCVFMIFVNLIGNYTCRVATADRNGYVMYCPCMGRFGNQADHFLGSLAFARGLNRTLVLPPWIEYNSRRPTSLQISFDKYFLVEPLKKYHKVMTMEQFMTDLAPTIWPPGSRSVYCYGPRHGPVASDCNAKEGNPFGPFWDAFSVDFDHSEFFQPLSFNTWHPTISRQWNQRFPVRKHMVLAFSGAPAVFPVATENVELHKYLHWSPNIVHHAQEFIREHIAGQPFLGIHLRNGPDWTNVCKHVADSSGRHLFASAQCLGSMFEYGHVTDELCLPSTQTILSQVKQAVNQLAAVIVFVATDHDPMIRQIEQALDGKVQVIQRLPAEPHVDLAILGQANHYIGNCISTFSAFATRERRTQRKSVEFWGFHKGSKASDEL